MPVAIQPSIRPDDILLVIDMQNDFLAGGPLAVPGGNALIAPINALAKRFQHVIVTQDWHPAGHISFSSTHPGKQPFTDTIEASYGTQTLWPNHCLIGSQGAALHPDLDLPNTELVLRKGFRTDIDSYSAFLENDGTTSTGLRGYLRDRKLHRMFFAGVAYDFCVGSSAIDGSKLGFDCYVIDDLTAGIDATTTIPTMQQRLAAAGAHHITQADLR